MAVVIICSDFGTQENNICHWYHCVPIYLPWHDGSRCHDLSFWILSLKPVFSLSSFTFIKRLFNSSSLSAKRQYHLHIMLFIFLQATLIPTCVSSSLVFSIMYSEYKLNKQNDNIQPWCTPFSIWNHSVLPSPVLTDASWPAYRFLRRQISWPGIPVSWRIFNSLLWSHSQRIWHSP